MEKNEMSREQLIARIEVLEGQIVELKEAEDRSNMVEMALRESEERFRIFFNAAPIGLCITSVQGDILSANQAMQDILGYPLEELKTINISEFYFEPVERQRLLNMLYDSKHVRDFEAKLKQKDGLIWTVLINADCVDIDNQKVFLTSIHDITRFKQVQEVLRESEERYQQLFDIAPVGITVTDYQGNVTASNKSVQDLLGYTAEEFKTIDVFDFYLDRSERQRLLNLMEKTGAVRDFETMFKRKDGKVFTVLMNSDLIDFGDQYKVMLTSIRDITNLKQAQEEFRKERDFTNAILDTAASLVMVLDREGLITRFNRACEKATGYSSQEMKDQHIWDTLTANPANAREKVEQLLAGNYPSTHESFWITRCGEQRLISWLNTVLLDNEGKVEYIIATGIDITDRKQAEEEIIESKNFLATLLESIPAPVFYKDIDGRYLGFNRAFEDFFGKTKDELIGKSVFDINPVKLAGIYHAKDVELFERPGTQTYETQVEDARGVLHDVVFYKASTVNFRGMVTGLIGTILDITERKQAETRLQEANQKMAVWVSELEERTAEMSQLIEMGEQLQSCQTVEEACAISAQYIQKLFPSSQGALYLISPSKDLAEAVNMWGDSPSTEKVFMPLNCWAVRSGRPHLVDGSHPGLLCGHITGPSDGQYLCVPMMDHDEAIGILHLNHTAHEQEQQKSTGRMCSEHKNQLALAVADHIALALSNLRMRETLHQQAIRDMLTGLFNRRYMEESLARELHQAQRVEKPVGVIMFDIDHFKDFNDLFGHAGGDALLRKLGAFLNNHTRRGDIVSRYGGEEFVYVLPGASLEETRLRAEDLRQGVTELRVFHLGEPLGKITISFGVAVFPEHGLTSEAILKKADNALYRAKNEGRDRVVVASTIG